VYRVSVRSTAAVTCTMVCTLLLALLLVAHSGILVLAAGIHARGLAGSMSPTDHDLPRTRGGMSMHLLWRSLNLEVSRYYGILSLLWGCVYYTIRLLGGSPLHTGYTTS
jgi:hypothetical protein